MDAIFRVDGNRVLTSPDAAGPWDPGMQHGSAPASLVVWAAEAIPTPVPMRYRARHHRPDAPGAGGAADARDRSAARRAQDPALRDQAARRRCRRGRRHRAQDQDAGADAACPDVADLPVELPGPDQSRVEPANFSSSPFVTGMSLRAARGSFGVPGPGAIWYRADRPLVEGSPVSQAMRAVVAADFCNGTSSVLDFRAMDVHQRRPYRQFCTAAGRASGSCSMRNPGSVPMAPASRWRG